MSMKQAAEGALAGELAGVVLAGLRRRAREDDRAARSAARTRSSSPCSRDR
jgi:hypothetical protein